MQKKGIPESAKKRGDPAEIRFWMELADGENVHSDELPDTPSDRLARAKTNGGKKFCRQFATRGGE